MSPMARSFWAENRKVANAKTKAALGIAWLYPSYREGLRASSRPSATPLPGRTAPDKGGSPPDLGLAHADAAGATRSIKAGSAAARWRPPGWPGAPGDHLQARIRGQPDVATVKPVPPLRTPAASGRLLARTRPGRATATSGLTS